MAEAGGDWMSDYDTLPTQFLGNGNLTEHGQSMVPHGHIPALPLGSKEECLCMVTVIFNEVAALAVKQPDRSMTSDMFVLQSLLEWSS